MYYLIRMETIKKLHERQDQIVPNLRASEQQIRSEYLTLKNNYDDLQEKHQNDLVQLEEVKQNVSDIKHTLSATLKRNEELQSRCDELTSQCEAERKLRYERQISVFCYNSYFINNINAVTDACSLKLTKQTC